MAAAKPSQQYLALLRGINVGGRNLLPMKALAELFEEAACADVSTYTQSGNVLFTSRQAEAPLAGELSLRIEARFGYRIPVVLRTPAELSLAVLRNPYLTPAADEKLLNVYFLKDLPAKDLVATLDPGRSLPDTFTVLGREIYLHLPNGMARSKLTNAYFDAKLQTVSTARNWNTVQKLLALVKG